VLKIYEKLFALGCYRYQLVSGRERTVNPRQLSDFDERYTETVKMIYQHLAQAAQQQPASRPGGNIESFLSVLNQQAGLLQVTYNNLISELFRLGFNHNALEYQLNSVFDSYLSRLVSAKNLVDSVQTRQRLILAYFLYLGSSAQNPDDLVPQIEIFFNPCQNMSQKKKN